MQRLRMWLQEGFIIPTIPSSGQGKSAIYSREDIYAIALFMKLIERGFKRKLAGAYVNQIQKNDNSIIKMAPFLVFQTVKNSQNEETIVPMAYSFTPLILKIEAGRISPMMCDDEGKMNPVSEEQINWTSMLIINLADLKAEVDKVLG